VQSSQITNISYIGPYLKREEEERTKAKGGKKSFCFNLTTVIQGSFCENAVVWFDVRI
jgi:hypothetical protein